MSPSMWTWLSLAARMLALGATLPLVVAKFDASSVTLWYLFATIMALQLIADMGLSAVFARFYSYARGGAERLGLQSSREPRTEPAAEVESVNWQLVARLLATMRPAYLFVCATWIVGVSSVGVWAASTIVADSGDPSAAWMAFAAVVIGTTVRLYGNVYTSFLFGMEEIIAWRRAEAVTWLAAAATGIAVLVAGGGILALTLVTQGLLCLNVVSNARMTRRTLAFGGVDERGVGLDRAIWAEVWPRAVRGGFGVMMHAGVLHLAAVAVARLESPVVAGGYLIAYNVVRAADQFAQAPFYTKLPALAASRTRHDAQEVVKLAQRGMKATYWVLAVGLIAVGVVMPVVLEWFESSVQFVSAEIWAVMAAAVFVERYGANHIQLYMTTNHVVLHVANGMTGILFIGFCVASYSTLGLMAIPLSQLLANVCWFAWYGAWRSHGSIDIGFWQFERSTSIPPATLILIYVGLVFLTA